VLFESTLAAGLLGGFVQAVSGGALYRKSSFLLDSLGKMVFPKHIDILEDPFVLRGKGSSPFDEEGVRVAAAQGGAGRAGAGLFPQQLLGAQAGHEDHGQCRRLAQPGDDLAPHQSPGDDLDAMLQKLGTGLFVMELMGQGVNYVTGDYSRGASGFWVENGKIAFPVHEITIAGNLKDMLKGIEAVGADAYNYGAKTVGSILVNRMKVAGSCMSALPARRVLAMSPITLPMSPGPAGAQLGHDGLHGGGDLVGRQRCGQVGLQHGHFGGFSLSARSWRPAFKGGDAVLALLDELVHDGDDGHVVQHDALVHFLLLHRGQQQADGAQALAVLGAHGGFHVFGDLVFEAHGGSSVRHGGFAQSPSG
jgi:hypothetical protein